MVYGTSKFCGFAFTGRYAYKIAVIKIQRAIQVTVECRYIHYKLIQQGRNKIFFGLLNFRGLCSKM